MRRPILSSLIATVVAVGGSSASVAVTGQTQAAVRGNQQAPGFAGWSSAGASSSGFTTATAQVRLPAAFTCPSAGHYAYQIHMGWSTGLPSSGVGFADVFVLMTCDNGVFGTQTTVDEVDATGQSSRYLNASPGDTLAVTLRATHRGFQVFGNNVTTGQSWTLHGYTPSLTWSSADYSFQSFPDPTGAPVPVPGFTAIRFSNLAIGTHPAASALSLSGFDMYNGSHLLVRASRFNVAGNAFSDEFVSST